MRQNGPEADSTCPRLKHRSHPTSCSEEALLPAPVAPLHTFTRHLQTPGPLSVLQFQSKPGGDTSGPPKVQSAASQMEEGLVMLIPRTLPRPRHRNLWDEPGPGNLCLTTSLVSLPQSNLREPLSQLVHPFPTSSQALSGGANLGCPPLELPPAILTQPCGLNHRRPSTGCQARLRRGMIAWSLPLAPTPPPSLPLDPNPRQRTQTSVSSEESWVGRSC